jgi:hypothetical protein
VKSKTDLDSHSWEAKKLGVNWFAKTWRASGAWKVGQNAECVPGIDVEETGTFITLGQTCVQGPMCILLHLHVYGQFLAMFYNRILRGPPMLSSNTGGNR